MAKQGSCYSPPQLFCSVELTRFLLPFNIMSGRNTRLRLLDESLGCECIGLWDTNCLGCNGLDSNVTDANGSDTLAVAYCMLLRYCTDSVCVGELMQCFRSTQCCALRGSTAPKVLHWIPRFFMHDCFIVM